MKKNPLVYLSFVLLMLSACATKKIVQATPPPVEEMQNAAPAEMAEAPPVAEPEVNDLPLYNPSYKKEIDLVHTKLDLRFDMAKEQVIGKAELTCKPYFYPISRLRLDAKGFIINKISLAGKVLKYDYDNNNLYINLDRNYTAKENFVIAIDYIARPSETPAGGSDAITSEKGLFFIDAQETDPDKPTQIWSQGETENNSRWFPTIDKPNDRCTEEMYLTVENKFKTLSNGLLVSSKDNMDGTRTDYWKMDMPHAPYLFMIAIGDFSVTQDKWRDIPLTYYVEPEYAKDAKAIYNNTPEILEFFSTRFGLKYPWPKLGQIVVRDYVSGAMENTTGIIYGESIQKHADELLEDNNDGILAHEISHHWFGDYVTCESWANLTLNEGFANYSEYLWTEHKYGYTEAEMHRLIEMDGYLGSTRSNMHSLINYGYNHEMEMFDAHSYNKGGLILHMLRKQLGDDAFFGGLQKYLEKNALKSVEADNLRQAFEEMTGQDLKWYFDQWFFASGHPVLDITKNYDEANAKLTVTISQKQSGEKVPHIFQFPLRVDIYDRNGKMTSADRWVNERTQSFEFSVPNGFEMVNVDPERLLLCERNEDITPAEAVILYKRGSLPVSRFEAVKLLNIEENKALLSKELVAMELKDSIKYVRMSALEHVDTLDQSAIANVRNMADNDPSYAVRGEAIKFLAAHDKEYFKGQLSKYIASPSDEIRAMVLSSLYLVDKQKALEYAAKFESGTSVRLASVIANIYEAENKADKLPWLEAKIKSSTTMEVISIFGSYSAILYKAEPATQKEGINFLEKIATDKTVSKYKRFGAAAGIFQVMAMNMYSKEPKQANSQELIDELKGRLQKIMDQETDPELIDGYKRFRLD